jgi:hypothetical protein
MFALSKKVGQRYEIIDITQFINDIFFVKHIAVSGSAPA